MTQIPNADLTSGTVNGNGVFDLLMRAAKAHIDEEFKAGRIKGAEYAQVYLGAITSVMQNGTQFLLGQLNADKQAALIDAQIAKTNAEKLLVDAQKDLTSDQKTKFSAEIALLGQKKLTEEAQISDNVNGSTVGGLLGKQKELYAKQRDGFDRDAEQKITKILVDSWSVRRTTDEGTLVPSGLDDASINAVITQAKSGINA